MSPAVEFRGLSKSYGTVAALKDLSLSIPRGALYGIVGPNGAGKTTTFGLLSGFLRPTAGEVWLAGERQRPGHPPTRPILSLPQDSALPPRRRVLEVLAELGRLGGLPRSKARAEATEALARVGLSDMAGRRVGQLSNGERRRVGIAQTLIGPSELIVLDEPTQGLDPRAAADLRALIATLHQGRTMILSSHNLQEVEALSTHAAILDRGVLVASGTMDEIKRTAHLVHVVVAEPVTDQAELERWLGALPAVTRVSFSGDGTVLNCEFDESYDETEATNEVLKCLLEKGVGVRSVDRGKSLEARFMEATRPKQ